MGPLFVALAAILWATDAIVRYPLVQAKIDPVFIVFFDHLIGVAVLTPWILWRHRKEFAKVTPSQWVGLGVLGGGASAIATIFFTASFKYVNPSVSILLQKLQPVIVVLLAMAFLKERPARSFWIWAPVALFAGVAISFPTFDFRFASEISPSSQGSLYAFAAAAIWAVATVIGKGMVTKLSPTFVTYARFVFGLATSAILLAISGGFGAIGVPFSNPELMRSFAYISLVPGLLALLLYYQGMLRTNASTTTFMELLFPVTAIAVNTYFLDEPLLAMQMAAALVLLFAVTQISLAGPRKSSKAGKNPKAGQRSK